MTALDPRETTGQLPYLPDEERWDNDEEDLPVRPPRLRLGPLSLLLVGALVAAGAFYGGVLVEKHQLPGGTTVSAAARARTAGTTATTVAGGRTGTTGAGAAAATGGGAGGTAGAAGGGSTFGTVKLIDGNNVYVQDTTGTITKVATNAQSTISITSNGTAKDIKPGDTVVVSGTTGTDGTVTATSVRDVGAGGAGLGGFGGGRRSGAAGATGTAAGGGGGFTPPAGGLPGG
jgi:hypothetical protein